MGGLRWSKIMAILLIVVIGSLGLMKYTAVERPQVVYMKQFIQHIFTPLQGGVNMVLHSANEISAVFISKERLRHENQMLLAENEQLLLEHHQLKEEQKELERLRELLRFKEVSDPYYDLSPARVIARHPSNWFQKITIDRGARDGLAKDMVVITSKGLVGRIYTVNNTTADVLLLTDREGAVGAVVLNQETRTPGIVEGTTELNGLLEIKHIAYDAPVEVGQMVITSGLSQIFPGGLPIGTIIEVGREAEPSGLLKYALIRPVVNFNQLEEVLVIKQVLKPVDEMVFQ